jgi:hypothetical protein
MIQETSSRSRLLWVLLGGWLVSAAALGRMGALLRSPVPPPIIALALAAVALAVASWSRGLRGAVSLLDTNTLVAVHVVRLVVGVYFLILWRAGVLPGEFAMFAGWGDIVVGAAAALLVAWSMARSAPISRRALLVWNTAGLVDILAVLLNGMRIFTRDPGLLTAFGGLPLALLPLFVVPIVIATHMLLFMRVRLPRGASHA